MSVDFTDELAALRGKPSLVWQAGQNRRLDMIVHWGGLTPTAKVERIIDAGCGVGMYIHALMPFAHQLFGLEIEAEHLIEAVEGLPTAHFQCAATESLPYPDDFFDLMLSHEVLEHVANDQQSVGEMVRVLKPGGRAVIFAPNRLAPFETHGHYWRGVYHFGNTPLINYLPDVLRNKLAPHVRAYTPGGLRSLFIGQPVRIIHHTQIYPGWDKVVHRRPLLGKWLRRATYAMEKSPLRIFGLSHLLVIEKV